MNIDRDLLALFYKKMRAILVLSLTLGPIFAHAEAKQEARLYPEGLISLSTDSRFSQYAFAVDKSRRLLQVYEAQGELPRLVSEHPADIGKRNGDKERENDHKTPVGIYFLQKRISPPEIPFSLYGSLAFTTDYPNIFDKRVAKGGSGIWLHAIPDKVPLTRGSRGCVVVRNDVIQSLANYVKLGQTPILIFDEIKYLTEKEYRDQRALFLGHFESWKTAWQQSDVDTYIQFYDPTFRNDQMNYSQWYRHKKRLKKVYKYIQVEMPTPLILRNKDQVVVRTLQNYESDLHKDFGEKTLHASFSDQVGFRIIREDWRGILDNERLSQDVKVTDKAAYPN